MNIAFDRAIEVIGSKPVYYSTVKGDPIIVVYPDSGLEIEVCRSHFEKAFVPYNIRMPPEILAQLDAMESYYKWYSRRHKETGA